MIHTTGEESSAVIRNRKIWKVWVSRWRVKGFIDHSGSSETQGGRKEGRMVCMRCHTKHANKPRSCVLYQPRAEDGLLGDLGAHRVTTVEP